MKAITFILSFFNNNVKFKLNLQSQSSSALSGEQLQPSPVTPQQTAEIKGKCFIFLIIQSIIF